MSYLPFVVVSLPLAGAFAAYVAGKHARKAGDTIVLITSFTVFACVTILVRYGLGGKVFETEWLGVVLRVDEITLIMAFVTSLLWLMSSIYSMKYMEKENNLDRYYMAMLLTQCGCLGVAFSGGIIELFVFFEMASLIPYILILHSHSALAHKAASKYLYMCVIGGFLVFYGVVVTFWLKDTGSFSAIGIGQPIPVTAVVAFLIGFGIKGGVVPLHSWLPDAHSVSPSSISCLLSGITVKVGMFSLVKLVYYIAPGYFSGQALWDELLIGVALVSIMLGSVVAIGQKRIKRMLAYSTIGQMGYIVLGIAMMTTRGLTGALYHFFSHSMMKGSLFLIAGALKHKKDIDHLEDFKGLAREMPITMACYTVAALSMVGIPLFGGFTSKWYLGLGCLDAGGPLYLAMLLLSSLLNVIYFFPPAINAFFPRDTVHHGEGSIKFDELHPLMLVPIVILAMGIVYAGTFDNFMLKLARDAASRIMLR